MWRRTLFPALASVILLYSCKKEDPIADKSADPGNPGPTTVFNVKKQTMLDLVNQVRQQGCTCGTTVMPPVSPIAWNDQLAQAAYDHSIDMNQHNYFSHTGLDGSTAGQRITAAGYSWSSYGENIANGYPDEQAVMTAWLGSEGHCKNIMNGASKDMGVGRDGSYWTQVFASK